MSTSVLFSKARYQNAEQFVNTVTGDVVELTNDSNVYREKTYYLFIGHPQPWSEGDANPDEVIDSIENEYDAWYNMTALKKLTDLNVRLGFRRVNWTSGVVYDEYDDAVNLNDKNFYVMTSQFNVYKCISNGGGVPSTRRPEHLSGISETDGDGYKWKYMFTISQSDIDAFATPLFLPITYNSVVINNAADKVGSIEHLKLESLGSGYEPNSTAKIYVYGDGDEKQTQAAEAYIIVDEVGGITGAAPIVGSFGSGYSLPTFGRFPVMFRQITSQGVNESAFGLATTNAGGSIIAVEAIIPGEGYVQGVTTTMIQSSCQADAIINSSGKVERIDVQLPGTNFRKAYGVVVANSQTAATVRPIISPFRGHGGAPARELLGKYVLLNITLSADEGSGDFTIANDYRQIGLIENPYDFGTTDIATANTLNAKRTLNVTVTSGTFVADEKIYGQTSGASGSFIDIIDTNTLRYIKGDTTLSNVVDFEVGETIVSESGASATINSIVDPEVERFSGDILFINNRVPITRNANQVETVSFVLEY